ncbi:hypothetical protein [Demequina litorisediminis]|uniref:DUF3558 domain-containing protein n=1 Tax=Demequina litorisediminis TaxID=1849022 RepID=A0ABQ6II25_9MICO|nr:hypothetical protein [Demequina litorisediminis]GMA36811.1 hypothetical protein GCM10025876_30150 [Demequina litorisediminis]
MMAGGEVPMRGARWRVCVAGIVVPAVAALCLTGCLHGPGEFIPSPPPPPPTVTTAPPEGFVEPATVDLEPCSLLTPEVIADATGEVLQPAPVAIPTGDAHAAEVLGCRWTDDDGHEVSVLIDPTITDIDDFFLQASADAAAAGQPVSRLDVNGADLAFGGENDDFAAVAVVIDGVVHQVIYIAPRHPDRLGSALALAQSVVAAVAP